MVIKSVRELELRSREIDLTGPEGNSHYLLGVARQFGKQLNKDVDAIVKEMKSGDYDNLVEVFDREFGDIITLYREEGRNVKGKNQPVYPEWYL